MGMLRVILSTMRFDYVKRPSADQITKFINFLRNDDDFHNVELQYKMLNMDLRQHLSSTNYDASAQFQ